MKIIENNLKTNNPVIRIRCENCQSVLDVEQQDIKTKGLGIAFVTCPVCGKETTDGLDDFDKNLTVDNIEFPKDFFSFKDGVELNSDEIKTYIKKCIKHFREEPDAFCCYTGTGDTLVIVFNHSGDEEYVVNVCKGYYQANIPYDLEDYRVQSRNDWIWVNKSTANIGCLVRKSENDKD